MTTANAKRMIEKKQVQLIHIAKKNLNMNDDEYRLVLSRWNVTTCKDLSYRQAGEVIDYFKAIGFKLQSKRPRRANDGKQYASSLQGLREEIVDLARERFGDTWERSLINLCRRYGVTHYRWTDMRHGKEIKRFLVTQWTLNAGGGKE